MNENSVSNEDLVVDYQICEENEPLLDDKLLDVTPNVTVIDGLEEETNIPFCAKCRTISNSFLSTQFPPRSGHTHRRSTSLHSGQSENTTDAPRFYSYQTNSHNSQSFGDDTTLINAFDDTEEEGRGDFNSLSPEHCHTPKTHKKSSSRRAITKLLLASVLTSIFMVAETAGGYIANSIAIMSDAAHLLSDLTSFLVSLVAIYLAMRPASKKMSYGYQRAEVLGAVVSVLIIWLITGVLVYIAIQRIISMDFELDADTMIIVSALGVVVNLVLGAVLHTGHGHGHGHSHGGGSLESSPSSTDKDNSNNVNLRAAFIHVLGDLIQSIGVLISAYIIRYYPQYKIADPICTFLFSVIVIVTTIPILKDLALVLMEGTPPGSDYTTIVSHLSAIPGVKMVHSLHVWALTLDKNALSVHLAIAENSDSEVVLKDAQRVIRSRHLIDHTTIQVEKYQPLLMDNCQQCQPLLS